MQKRIISLDFDGCLFNKAYRTNRLNNEKNPVILSNKQFLKHLKQENSKFDEVVVFVGSNRQAYRYDCQNSNKNKTESAFTAIKSIKKYLHAKLDKFLLADLENDSVPGTAFNAAISASDDDPFEDHHHWLFDVDKLALLYAQLHKAASDDPSETVFDFYDDKGLVNGEPTDILSALREFFIEYPMMIPRNTTLRLNHYDGDKITNVATIVGEGDIDHDYYNTLHLMEKIAHRHEICSSEKHFTRYITPNELNELRHEKENKRQKFGTLHRLFHLPHRNKQKNPDTKVHAVMNSKSSRN